MRPFLSIENYSHIANDTAEQLCIKHQLDAQIIVYSYEWDQQMHCKFPIFINDTIALHVSGSFSAHHQERYQPYNGFGTISCSSVTDCCQEQDGTARNM